MRILKHSDRIDILNACSRKVHKEEKLNKRMRYMNT